MKILVDHCVPVPLLEHLKEYDIVRSGEQGWAQLSNGKLLQAAEEAGIEVLLTLDTDFLYQHNMSGRRIAVLVLSSMDTRLSALLPLLPALRAALEEMEPGTAKRVPAT